MVRLTKRRLVILAAGACVVAVAVAAALGWWQVALVVMAALQAGAVILAVDHRGRGATSREVRKASRAVLEVHRTVENVGTRLTSVAEMTRLESNDHLDVANRELATLGRAVDAMSQTHHTMTSEVTTIGAGVGTVSGAVGELSSRLDAWRGDLDRTNQKLVEAYENVEHRRLEAEKSQTWTNARQLRQVEALLQLFGRITPRAAMPSSGGWALDATGLLTLLEAVERQRPRTIVELGSGTSSVWLGYALERLGAGRLISIDHEEQFGAATRSLIAAHGLDDVVEVRLAPLTASGIAGHDTPWYDSSVLDDVTEIDLLIIDGPPKKTGPLSRYPALPKLMGSLSDRALVAVDDANRPDEREMVERWQEQFGDLRDEAIPPGGSLRILVRDPRVADANAGSGSSAVEHATK